MTKKLMVIDGNSLLYRAFYALPILTNKKGVYTNAVYGFSNMLLKLMDNYEPDFLGVAFDKSAHTFRNDLFKEYKAKRQKMPEELVPQFDLLKKLLSKMDIPIYEIEGYEADDILGSFAKLAEDKNLDAYLVTGDKDALQLVSESVKVIHTKRGITEIKTYTNEEVENEFGFGPTLVTDYKGLRGDTSDNIPGVPGVGEKTATKLIMQFGCLENVLEHIDEVKGKKLKENLTTYREQAILSKKLAVITKDAPVDINLEDCCYNIPKSKELTDLLKELGFNSVISKLGLEDQVETQKKKRKKEIKDISLDDLDDIFDTEKLIAIHFDDDITLSDCDECTYRIKVKKDLIGEGVDFEKAIKSLKPYLENKEFKKVIHDSKLYMLNLNKRDVKLKGVEFDTLIAAYLIDATRSKYTPTRLVYDYLDIDIDKIDASEILMLSYKCKEILESTNMLDLYYSIEHPLIEVLTQMEQIGFRVDKDKLSSIGEELSSRLEELTTSIYDIAGESFNINSPKQLGVILFEKLSLPIIKKTKTGYSTNIEVLEKLKGQHPIIDKIMDYRQTMKLKSTYIDGLISVISKKDGRIHSSFNQTVTSTGRISSTEPNLQNIPVRLEMGRQIRKVFVASDEEHILVDADYSQIELRLLAHISDDPTLIDAFVNNQDIHTRTASEIFNIPIDEVTSFQRGEAKAVNFGIVYGISDFGLSRNLGIPKKKAKKYIDSYFERYKKVKEYMENIVIRAKEQGFVTTLMNRRRDLPELNSRNFNIRSLGERLALNTPIQGTAADVIKMAMNNVFYELNNRGLRSKLILQVHDELIVDTYLPELDEVKELVMNEMQNVLDIKVPLVVDINTGYNWYDAK